MAAIRGGELWTGNIVQILGEIGIAEPGPPALNRLVASGRLEAASRGSRFYRLTRPQPSASWRSRPSDLCAGRAAAPAGWHLVLLPETGARPPRRRSACCASGSRRRGTVLPDRGAPLPPLPGCRFHALDRGRLAQPLAGVWPFRRWPGEWRTSSTGSAGCWPASISSPGRHWPCGCCSSVAFARSRCAIAAYRSLPGGWPGRRRAASSFGSMA